MKLFYFAFFLLVWTTAAHAQHELRWMVGMDYGIPWKSFDQGRNVLRGTVPSHQLNLNTGMQYRAFNRLGIELGVGQAVRKFRMVDDQLRTESPSYRAVLREKNLYLSAFGGLQWYFPLPAEDYFVLTGGYAWNYVGSKGLAATTKFVEANQDIAVQNQYQGSNHSFYGELGYEGVPAGRSTLYIGLKVNIGQSPILKGQYVVTDQLGSASYSDAFQDKGSYIGMNLKYYLRVFHKDKVKRAPKPERAPRQRKRVVDTPPTEVKQILKDTMLVEGRQVIVGKTIVAQHPDVTIQVWDAEAIDGDSITLILNGIVLVENLPLTDTKFELKAKLQPGKNYLVLHAKNQGKYPPNTAAIIVDDGNRKNQVALKSNLKSSGALEITLGK